MPENVGYYEKYRVERVDGKAIDGRTWTLEIDRDPFARPALRAYRDAAQEAGGFDELVRALDALLGDEAEA